MRYIALIAMLLMVLSSTANAEGAKQIGTGKEFLAACENLIRTGEASNINEAQQGSYCMGYVNGLAQVLCDKSYNDMYIQDIGVAYITYLKSHPEDQNLENSILFKRMVDKNGS
jgi:hypothetical protein